MRKEGYQRVWRAGQGEDMIEGGREGREEGVSERTGAHWGEERRKRGEWEERDQGSHALCRGNGLKRGVSVCAYSTCMRVQMCVFVCLSKGDRVCMCVSVRVCRVAWWAMS